MGGRVYTIPSLPASAWLLPILEGGWIDIVPGLLGDDPRVEQLRDDLVDGVVGYDECRDAAQAALVIAAGTRRWWSVSTLSKAVMMSWIAGELVRGVDLDRVSLAAFLAASYRIATENMDRSAKGRFDMELDRPPRGLAPEEWLDEDEAEQSFLALMGTDGSELDDDELDPDLVDEDQPSSAL